MTKRVAFIGLGIMGLPMAGHLLAAGHAMAVHTRTRGKAEAILAKGATWAESPREAAAGAEVVFVCVTDTPDVRAVLTGAGGVIEAAKSKGPGFYAIGVDQDQDGIAPGRVLTSMVKHVDTAVYDTIKRAKDHTFAPGTIMYDLKQGGVGLSEMKYTKHDVPADVLAKLDKLRKLVEDGTCVPPTTLEAVKDFQPPKL